MTVKLVDKLSNKEKIMNVKKIETTGKSLVSDSESYFKFYFGNGAYSEEYNYDRYSFEIIL